MTVEKKEGKLKSDKDITVIDLPGIYSLSPYTLEEVVARGYLIRFAMLLSRATRLSFTCMIKFPASFVTTVTTLSTLGLPLGDVWQND